MQLHTKQMQIDIMERMSLIRAEPLGEAFADLDKIPDKASEIHVAPYLLSWPEAGMVLIETRCKLS
jgi:hypothetical protein